MKFIVLASLVAYASAGYVAPLYYGGHQHLPVIGPNGVPIDTAEVQHARAAHFVHKAEAKARNGDYYGDYSVYAAPWNNAHLTSVAHGYHHGINAYPTTAVLPAAINGVPLDTPEVAAAKSHHFAAHAEALARTAHHGLHYRKRRGLYAVAPLSYAHGGYYGYHGPQHLPIIGHNGVPIDTPEVQLARAAHLSHKAAAYARNGDYYGSLGHYSYASPLAHYY